MLVRVFGGGEFLWWGLSPGCFPNNNPSVRQEKINWTVQEEHGKAAEEEKCKEVIICILFQYRVNTSKQNKHTYCLA
jgi:hypothetical protein